jgi:hypothetical protein
MARGDLNSAQVGRETRGDALTDRQVEAAILRVLTNKVGLSERTVQQIQELIGERGEPGKPRSAVRRQDLSAIGRLPQFSARRDPPRRPRPNSTPCVIKSASCTRRWP